MYYLQSQLVVHRDISYTNILLRDQGKDSQEKVDKRREIMNDLGLSEIEDLRNSLGCREGLLIDFDYASSLDPNTDTCSVNEQGGSQLEVQLQSESRGSIQSSSQATSSQASSQASSQVSGRVSGQGESREDSEVVDNEDNSKTVIQPINRKCSGMRTVSYFK